MINVLTVHWRSAEWIDPQLRYLERNIDEPYRVFAALHGVDRREWDRFHFAADLEGDHPEKLNALAELAMAQSGPDDVLMFIDGDALPVRPLARWIAQTLETYPLAAVRRDENLGDPQPHPCFSITTCGFWREIQGDWRKGATWTNSLGETVTDPGGNLLRILEAHHVDWLPLLRTNTSDEHHPLWFAVYDHRVYHHGAGFRDRHSRLGTRLLGEVEPPSSPTLQGLARQVLHAPSMATDLRGADLRRAAAMTLAKQRYRRSARRRAREDRRSGSFEREVFERLGSDPEFYRTFDATDL